MKKPRVLVLTYGKLPIPAVKGGAIETLLDSLIEENEQQQQVELIVLSGADPAISAFNQTHKYTQVISGCFKNVGTRGSNFSREKEKILFSIQN